MPVADGCARRTDPLAIVPVKLIAVVPDAAPPVNLSPTTGAAVRTAEFLDTYRAPVADASWYVTAYTPVALIVMLAPSVALTAGVS